LSTEPRPLSLNPRPDALLESPSRDEFFEEIRRIGGIWKGGFHLRAETASGSASDLAIDQSGRAAIRRYAVRIARKAQLPEIADNLETEGLSIFAEEAARVDYPSDVDPWGIVQKRVWDRLWNTARREPTKRFHNAAKLTVVSLEGENGAGNTAIRAYEAREGRLHFHKGVRPNPDEHTIQDAVNGLPEPHKTIVRSRYWRGRTQAELASELGISQGSVSRYLGQAESMLAEKLSHLAE